ncbi:MAG: GGDEF domain-containing protein [Candidatus Pacearchaeota archaeon]|nr:GGDEF domain-containing protein [Candidatus Pacearchaeota archaeon]
MDFKKKLNVLDPETRKSMEKILEDLARNINYLYTIATIDEKTGIYNNKFFNKLAESEIEKAKRGMALSLLIIDLDNFKRINDKYGHIIGDKMLEHFAKILKKTVRKYDIYSRFGGEEFFVLFPGTSMTRAKKVADRIRKKIELDTLMKKRGLTISGGIAQYKQKDNIKTLSKRADKALYKAKKQGKNRIETE